MQMRECTTFFCFEGQREAASAGQTARAAG
jgi:hypothetical protein